MKLTQQEIYDIIYERNYSNFLKNFNKDKSSRMANKIAVKETWENFNIQPELKDFNDLIFETHPSHPYGDTWTSYKFDNNVEISVMTNKKLYPDEKRPYEVSITDYEIIGNCSKKDITYFMIQIQLKRDIFLDQNTYMYENNK